MINRNHLGITALIALIIIYGSLYPFDFRQHATLLDAFSALIGTWKTPPSSFGDLVANILLYVPLGYFGVNTFRSSAMRRTALIVCFGFSLCVVIELAQYYDRGRVTNASDVYLNTFGTALGAIAGGFIGTEFHWPLLRAMALRPAPALLLAGWLGYRLFPYVPTIDLHKYWDSLKPVIFHPTFPLFEIFRYGVLWLIVAALVEAIASHRRSRLLFPIVLGFVLAAKILIVSQRLSAAELVGALTAYLVWQLLLVVPSRHRSAALFAMLGSLVLAQRLAPFHFAETAGHFGLIPFLSFMKGSLETNIQVFFEKFFLYGALIWLMSGTGILLRSSTLITAASLLVTSVLQIYLPGRSAEITDAVMAIIIGGIFALTTQAATPPAARADMPQRQSARKTTPTV